ncbi:MAG: calcium/proton exchanger [Candidatus Eremiobacterota bacterium]
MLSRGFLVTLVVAVLGLVACMLFPSPSPLRFALATAAMVPIGIILGRSSEELACRLGPALGALLNATFGNAPELVILYLALLGGHTTLVQATITGSIMCNLLIVVGLSATIGGLRHKTQSVNPAGVALNLGTLTLVVAALLLPAAFAHLPHPSGGRPLFDRLEEMSLCVAAVLITIYILNLLYSLRTHRDMLNPLPPHEHPPGPVLRPLLWMLAAAGLVVFVSDQLVDAATEITSRFGFSQLFVGVVGLAAVGNAADYAVGVQMAWRNKLDLSFSIAASAVAQVALFVAPLLVLTSRFTEHPLTLSFSALEVLAVGLSALVVGVHSLDGAFTWFEGAQLLALYGILGAAFFFY